MQRLHLFSAVSIAVFMASCSSGHDVSSNAEPLEVIEARDILPEADTDLDDTAGIDVVSVDGTPTPSGDADRIPVRVLADKDTVVNDLPCMITSEGNALNAILQFERACGIGTSRMCTPYGDTGWQCDNFSTSETHHGGEAMDDVGLPEPFDYSDETEISEDEFSEFEFDEPTQFSEENEFAEVPEDIVPAEKVEPYKPQSVTVFEPEHDSQSPISCETDDFTFKQAQELFGKACAANGYHYVGCNVTVGDWTCADAPYTPIEKEMPEDTVDDVSTNGVTPMYIKASNITANNISYVGQDWANAISNGQMVVVSGVSDNVAAVLEYIDSFYSDTNTAKVTVVGSEESSDLYGSWFTSIEKLATYMSVDSDEEIEEFIEQLT